MLQLTRKLQEAVLLRLKDSQARARFTCVDFKPQSVTIEWDRPAHTTNPRPTFDTGQPLSFLFCGRRVTIHVVKVQGGQCRLEFDAPREILIDRAERVDNNKSEATR